MEKRIMSVDDVALYFGLHKDTIYNLVKENKIPHIKIGGQKGPFIPSHEEEEPEWSKGRAITILALTTVAVVFVSERLVSTFDVTGATFGWSELFIGVIIVAIVGMRQSMHQQSLWHIKTRWMLGILQSYL